MVLERKVRRELRFRFRGREVALDRFRRVRPCWTAARRAGRHGDQGRVRRRRLRRVHCGAGAAETPASSCDEAVNVCIIFLGQLDGAELITVEDLAEGGSLHPVQQAMVDHHGSQCGFCTPGIVMSIFAAYHSGAPATVRACATNSPATSVVAPAIAPSSTAALATCDGAPTDRFAALAGERAAALEALADEQRPVRRR